MYDLVDEKDYVQLVQQRRNAEDFVVDDGAENTRFACFVLNLFY